MQDAIRTVGGITVSTPRMRGGYRIAEESTTPMAVRRIVRDARIIGRKRRARRAVIEAARARRLTAIAEHRASLPATDDRHITLTAVRPVDAMTAIEEHILTGDARRRATERIMAATPSRDGRGTVDAMPSSVNGTETRVSRRWHGTPRSAIVLADTAIVTIDPTTGYVASIEGERPDWSCYRVMPDGTRVPLVTTATAKRRKRKSTARTATAKRAALMARATTKGHVESMAS